MSAAVMILPVVWATEARPATVVERRQAAPELAFYRKYTEGLLRRYLKMSMEAGRAPSLLGREMFRGKVTNYRVQGFDDVVIFVHDVEKCLATLDEEQQTLIERIALQEYSHGETAGMMGLHLWTVTRGYSDALDALTELFLERKLLEPLIACQEVENRILPVTY
jgi:hypothetical protein